MSKPTYQPGVVLWIELGTKRTPANPTGEVVGHEQANKRPCIVIQSFPESDLLVIVPMTTKVPNKDLFVYTYPIPAGAPQPQPSYALCHQVRSVAVDRVIGKPIGTMPSREFNKVKSRLRGVLKI